MQTTIARASTRNRRLDLLRLLFAVLVLLGHAPEVSDGNRGRELLTRWFDSPLSFGDVAVDGFFVLSGWLIVQSWQRSPELVPYLQRRVLRIVPGFLVAAVLSTVALGLLAPGTPTFFHELLHSHLKHFVASIVSLHPPDGPPVLPGLYYNLINGSLWTISYEFRCYLLVALLGVTGLLARRWLWLALTGLLLGAAFFAPLASVVSWTRFTAEFGEAHGTLRLTAIFLVGGCFVLFEPYLRCSLALAVTCCAAIVLSLAAHRAFEATLAIAGAYLLYYVAHVPSRWIDRMPRFPDISYGVYLYGWPVEVYLAWKFHPSPWTLFAVAVPACVVLGAASWYWIEKPALHLARRPSRPVAAGPDVSALPPGDTDDPAGSNTAEAAIGDAAENAKGVGGGAALRGRGEAVAAGEQVEEPLLIENPQT